MSEPILVALRITLAVSLYLFLGWALYTLWRELRRQSRAINPPPPPTLILSRYDSGDPHHMRFTIPEVMIGRDPACDIILTDSTVSARHARLFHRQSQWWLEDLRSTNGTLLNGQGIDIPMVVTSGDRMSCGQVQLTIEIEDTQAVATSQTGA